MDRSIVDTIVKFIKTLYKPEDIAVSLLSHVGVDNIERPEYYIYVYFDYIDDKYISNRHFKNTVRNKEMNLRVEIRKYVESYFGIKTSGHDLNNFSPFVYHGLTIEVKSNEDDDSLPFPLD